MSKDNGLHTFHIPVMGTGYTIDTPLKVARYGIDSVVSIIDHRLTETMREFHSNRLNKPFAPIGEEEEDCRARRITAYLDFLHDQVEEQFETLRSAPFTPGTEITKYFEMLPETSDLKLDYKEMLNTRGNERTDMEQRLRNRMKPGSIDVNIMTKLDAANYDKTKQPLPVAFNDAHAVLRGFAMSKLDAAVVLSAGLNPRLYGYIASFPDFFPGLEGRFKKRIILKVSDYRSALIQGKFLAKKGIWVSEFRIESGLNCGGHAFATDGYLLGPIMQEFKDNRKELISSLFDLYSGALVSAGYDGLQNAPACIVSVQGGVGIADEHRFLLEQYDVHSVGWGSPFLLVPEAVNIDGDTMNLLSSAGEDQFYLSEVSPLGVPFNTVRNNTAEVEKQKRIDEGKPGSPCYKKHLVSNTEFTDKPICVASRQYQKRKIAEFEATIGDKTELKKAIQKVTEKMCLCVGLGNAALLNAKADLYRGMHGVAVCPGPNLAYFSRVVSLRDMIDHIYGRANILQTSSRPHMFVKEFKLYVDYLFDKVEACRGTAGEKQASYFQSFQQNLNDCADYYKRLIADLPIWFDNAGASLLRDLNALQFELNTIVLGDLRVQSA